MTTLPVAAGPFPVRAGRPRDDDWIPADNLLEPGSPLLEERLLAFGKRLGTTRAAVALSLLLEAYTGLLASVAFGSLLGAGRAPELAVGNVSVRRRPAPAGARAHRGAVRPARLSPARPASPARGGPGPPCHRRPAGAQAAELLPLVRAAGLRLLRHLSGVERPARGRAGGGTAGRAAIPRLILSSGSRLDRPIRSRPESHSL